VSVFLFFSPLLSVAWRISARAALSKRFSLPR
jgi:hypothetical protein